MPAKVIVQNLHKRYDDFEAVRGVSFAIEEGEIFGLLGPNGAGKTTTVECLIGLREPDSGELEVCGLDARRYPRAVKEKIGVALQSTSLQDKITPREALRLFGSFYSRREEPAVLLERFALVEKADAALDTLSGGQRQRLALALAFVNRPELVFLDEPTTGLDPQARRELHGAIAEMKAAGCTVLFTTHYLDEAEALCDRVAIIDQGRMVATGSPRELMARAAVWPTVTLATSRAVARERWASVVGVSDLWMDASGLKVQFRTEQATATLVGVVALLSASGVDLVDLEVKKASLEDVFLNLTRTRATAAKPARVVGEEGHA
ncbi:MAG: hypothetical protein RL077_2585 [Verrucomicrobiota bacterium]|jgi:ABC-2 type transport system ATP-binding protein